mgnify:CR=1 FL=1
MAIVPTPTSAQPHQSPQGPADLPQRPLDPDAGPVHQLWVNRKIKRHIFVPTGTDSPALGGTPGSSLGSVGLAERTLRSRGPVAGPENRLNIG